MIHLLTHSKHRNFQRLWFAQLLSQFGDRIHQFALIKLVAERASGSPMELAKLLAFTIIPVFLIQPFAGVLVDRWDRKKILFICDVARGLLVLTIPFIFMYKNTMLPIYGVVFLVFCCSRFYLPAKMSILPDIVDEKYLFKANSLVSTTGMIAFVMGCALGGFLVDHFGARNGFLIDAGTFFLSGMILFNLVPPLKIDKKAIIKTGKEIVGPMRQSLWQEMKEGFVYAMTHKEIRLIIDMLFVVLFAGGAVYVVIIVFIQEAFGSVTKDLGVLAVCLGAGLFIGSILYGKWGEKSAWQKTIFTCLIGGGFMLIAFAVMVSIYPNIWIAMALACLWGIVIGPIFIAANAVAHMVSDESMRGKVFSAFEIVIHLAFLLSMFLSSWLATFIPHLWILIGAGVMIAVVGGGGLVMGRSNINKNLHNVTL
ncbi:hypothetical protein MNBD_UNCLBAC01-1350 [hydrothermal vent metagenome]|uniref:Major facilitator superfamily (MFS) profile domain-containing protein n=1 Tax=hydrothermal vent metagenome TaxID=652676 RepID=A0A3B1DPN4_9ZZZZ